MSRLFRWLLLGSATVALLVVIGLLVFNARHGPIPTLTLAAPQPGTDTRLVIVLPGIEDDLDSLHASGIGAAIQQAAPDMEVLLTGATPAYYLRQDLVRRLQQEIVAPARARGVHEIWMVGMSMGGFGTLLYEQRHPGEMTGLVLLAPFMGRPGLTTTIAAAGGLRQWAPPQQLSFLHPDRVPAQLWQMIRHWSESPERTQRIWLACGHDDSFMPASRLIAATLPADHFLERPGAHTRAVWVSAVREIFTRIGPPRP